MNLANPTNLDRKSGVKVCRCFATPQISCRTWALTNSMRLSSPKGAHAALFNAALQEIWVEPIRRLRGIPAKRKVGFRPLISPCYSAVR